MFCSSRPLWFLLISASHPLINSLLHEPIPFHVRYTSKVGHRLTERTLVVFSTSPEIASYFCHVVSNTYDHLTHTVALSPSIKSRYRACKAMKRVPMRSPLRQVNASVVALDNECPRLRGHLHGCIRKWIHAETRRRLEGVGRASPRCLSQRILGSSGPQSPVPSTGRVSRQKLRAQNITTCQKETRYLPHK